MRGLLSKEHYWNKIDISLMKIGAYPQPPSIATHLHGLPTHFHKKILRPPSGIELSNFK